MTTVLDDLTQSLNVFSLTSISGVSKTAIAQIGATGRKITFNTVAVVQRENGTIVIYAQQPNGLYSMFTTKLIGKKLTDTVWVTYNEECVAYKTRYLSVNQQLLEIVCRNGLKA